MEDARSLPSAKREKGCAFVQCLDVAKEALTKVEIIGAIASALITAVVKWSQLRNPS